MLGGMHVVVLPPDEKPPEDSDWVRIDRFPDDRYALKGCIATMRDGVLDCGTFNSADEAIRAAIDWGQERGSQALYVESHIA